MTFQELSQDDDGFDDDDEDESVSLVQIVAAMVHEACRTVSLMCGPEGDLVEGRNPSWANAPAWMKESTSTAVAHIWDHPEMTPEALHDRWMSERLAAGWTLGPEKDLVRKISPCLIPYDQLPANQQIKDHLFYALVSAARSILEPDERALH